MISIKEQLELAAKAAGYGEVWYLDGHDTPYVGPKFKLGGTVLYRVFNPYEDDGEAFRLAVKLNLLYGINTDLLNHYLALELPFDDPCAAMRRAIVCAAADLGRMT